MKRSWSTHLTVYFNICKVSYTVSAGDAIRIDPSGWAFAGGGFIRITSGSTEAADRKIKLLFRTA